jgi:solute carrier family 25 uncoupling protein 8/9
MVVADVACAGAGAAITDSIFNPLEVIKVRLQVAPQLVESPIEAAAALYRRGGLFLLWTPGLGATWCRAFGFTGLRVGLYPCVRDLLGASSTDTKPASLAAKVAAGAATGALGSAVANPVDLGRPRKQAQAGRQMAYGGSLDVVSAVINYEGGIAALWRGVSATAVRATLLSGAQLATYDQLKEETKRRGLAREGTPLHVLCGFASGLVGQTVCQPADTIKSRVLSGSHGSVLACVREILQREGLRGLYRGYLPAIARQSPVVLVQMPLIELIRGFVGLGSI